MSYRRGREFEYKVKRILEAHGFVVFRCAGSRPIDLIAFAPNRQIFFIECTRASKDRATIERQKALADRCGATYVLISRKNYLEEVRKLLRSVGVS